MSWCVGRSLTWLQRFVVSVIKCGHIPRHVAFIMDGNRRYAREKNMKTQSGHNEGLEKLKRLTYWCKEIGIPEVTVYAFSIDNFKRGLEEVNALMDLSRTEFSRLLKDYTAFMQDGIRIRFIGNLDLLPKDVRKLAAQLTFMTKYNKKLILNLAFSYTSRDEITNAIRTVVGGVSSGLLEVSDINEELLTSCMYTNHSEDPEIIIRTSGETRLSDFLLWQAQYSKIYVENVMWPEFNIWHLLKIIFLHHTTYEVIQQNKLKFEDKETCARKKFFLKNLDDTRHRNLQQYLNNS